MAALRKVSTGRRTKALPEKTLGETSLFRLVEEQARISHRDGNVVQTRLSISSTTLSIPKILRPLVKPPTPITIDDLKQEDQRLH